MTPHSTGRYHAQLSVMTAMIMVWVVSLLVGWTASDCRPNEWKRNAEPASGDVLRAISVTVGEWRAAGLAWDERCDRELPRIRVAHLTPAEAERVCFGGPSCAQYLADRLGTRAPERWYLVLSADHIRGTVHEMLHVLGACSGQAYGADRYHQDPDRWWSDAGWWTWQEQIVAEAG